MGERFEDADEAYKTVMKTGVGQRLAKQAVELVQTARTTDHLLDGRRFDTFVRQDRQRGRSQQDRPAGRAVVGTRRVACSMRRRGSDLRGQSSETRELEDDIMSSKKPIHEIRLGRIKAAIWENEAENGDPLRT